MSTESTSPIDVPNRKRTNALVRVAAFLTWGASRVPKSFDLGVGNLRIFNNTDNCSSATEIRTSDNDCRVFIDGNDGCINIGYKNGPHVTEAIVEKVDPERDRSVMAGILMLAVDNFMEVWIEHSGSGDPEVRNSPSYSSVIDIERQLQGHQIIYKLAQERTNTYQVVD